jgi:hypothetical protein
MGVAGTLARRDARARASRDGFTAFPAIPIAVPPGRPTK